MRKLFKVGAAAAACAVSYMSAAQAPGAAAAPTDQAPYIAPYYQQSWNDFLAMKAKAKPAKLPNWAGIWRRSFGGGQGSWGIEVEPIPGAPPGSSLIQKLTPKYKAALDEKIAKSDKGIDFDRLSLCLPTGMPRVLSEPFMREFIVTPEVTWMVHEQLTEMRRIYTDGKQHSTKGEVEPLWEGESIGFWDGDTLVIHTNNMKAGSYQRRQPDYSFKVSTVERVHSVDANTIQIEATIYDPESLTKPYKTKFVYQKILNRPTLRINYASCVEGNNAVITPEGGTTFVLPGEAGYHEPTTYGIPEVAVDSMPE